MANSEDKEMLENCLAAMRSPGEEMREWAASCFGVLAMSSVIDGNEIPDSLNEIWLAALNDHCASVREAAALSIMNTKKCKRLIPRLAQLAKDPAQPISVQVACLRALAKLGCVDDYAEEIVSLLGSDDPCVRLVVADALYSNPPKSLKSFEALYVALDDETPAIRIKVCWCIGDLLADADAVLPKLLDGLADQETCLDSARLLVRMGRAADSALEELIELMTHPHKFMRLQAVRATTHLTCPEEQAEIVLSHLENGNRSRVDQRRGLISIEICLDGCF